MYRKLRRINEEGEKMMERPGIIFFALTLIVSLLPAFVLVAPGYFDIAFVHGKSFLSAYAEDHGLCPWMNADSAATKSSPCHLVHATADSATGG
jgi:hypothetical protein